MGWPLLLGLGAAAAAAGTGMQMKASSDEERSMTNATEAELRRQQGYQQKSEKAAQTNVQANTPQATQANIDQGAKDALAAYQRYMTGNTASVPSVAPDQSSVLVTSPGQKAANEQQLQAASRLMGWQNMGLQQNLGNLRTGSLLNQYAQQAGASQRVLPVEMQAASQSAEGLRGAGQITGLLGSLAMMGGGLGGAGLLGGAAAPAATAPATIAAPGAATSPLLSYSYSLSPLLSSMGSGFMQRPKTFSPYY